MSARYSASACGNLQTVHLQAEAKDSEEQSKSDEDEGRYPERNAWTGGWAGVHVTSMHN